MKNIKPTNTLESTFDRRKLIAENRKVT